MRGEWVTEKVSWGAATDNTGSGEWATEMVFEGATLHQEIQQQLSKEGEHCNIMYVSGGGMTTRLGWWQWRK